MSPYLQLAKPRILGLVVITSAIGYYLAGGRDSVILFWTLLATGLASASAGSLNQLLEIEQDKVMKRTRTRPLPTGALSPAQALSFGLACAAAGLGIFAWKINGLSCALAAFTIAAYLLVYTPMKLKSPHSTWAGAVAGATPPLIGWAAARNALGPEAWALFSIQFLWQIPHFLAIFWMHREDYAKAGFRVMPVVDPGGCLTGMQIAMHSLGLLAASLLPALLGMGGRSPLPYICGALVLGVAFLILGLRASWTMAHADTRRLFLASLLYLPVLLAMLVAVSA